MLVRTVISLNKDDKKWLDKKASKDHIPMTEMVRRAIAHYRHCEDVNNLSANKSILQETSGIWTKGDGLSYQEKIRSEWDE